MEKKVQIVSLEEMLNSGQLCYDLDDVWARGLSTSVPKHSRLGKTFRELESVFSALLLDKTNTCIKLKFILVRWRLANSLLSRLLRDLIKRCRFHLDLIEKQKLFNNSNYVHSDRVSSLLKEISSLKSRELALCNYLGEAVTLYWRNSEVHAMEKELLTLQEKKECKKLEERLHGLKEKLMSLNGSTFLDSSVFSETEPSSSSSSSSSVYPLGSRVGSGSQVEDCNIEETPVAGDEVLFSMDAAALPWYLSNELLVVMSLVIVGCVVYFYLKGDDGDDTPSSGSSGIRRFKGLVDLLKVLSEEDEGRENNRHWWELSAVRRFAVIRIIIRMRCRKKPEAKIETIMQAGVHWGWGS